MLDSVFSRLNQLKELKIVKKTQEAIQSDALFDTARQVVTNAKSFTEDEFKALSGKLKIDQLSAKTSEEVEKILGGLVSKLVAGAPETVSDDVKAEIVDMLRELNTTQPRKLISGFKQFNDVLLSTAPKSISDIKNYRTTLAQRLVTDAKHRIEKRNGK